MALNDPSVLAALSGRWSFPTAIRFGCGRLAELPQACADLRIRRPLLVTDPGLAGLDMIARARALCENAGLGCGLFHDVQPNPVEANVIAGVAAMRAGDHDGVVAMGGGSALDAGKAVALMVGQSRRIFDFEDRADWFTRVDPTGMVPVVAIPTTAGTGSEVGRAAVITDRDDHTKKIIFHPRMMPGAVIADPELTAGLPPGITAAAGMDALSHSLEAFCSPVFHPLAQGIAVEGIRLVHAWLAKACADGGDLEARAHMQVASTMGATAFQKGLGAMHALSHPVGARLDAHHGLTNAVVMPYVLAYNRPAVEARLGDLARYLDLPSPSFAAVLDWVLELRASIGIPHTLRGVGMTEAHVATLAPMAVEDPAGTTNPLPVTLEAATMLYERALAGTLGA